MYYNAFCKYVYNLVFKCMMRCLINIIDQMLFNSFLRCFFYKTKSKLRELTEDL